MMTWAYLHLAVIMEFQQGIWDLLLSDYHWFNMNLQDLLKSQPTAYMHWTWFALLGRFNEALTTMAGYQLTRKKWPMFYKAGYHIQQKHQTMVK